MNCSLFQNGFIPVRIPKQNSILKLRAKKALRVISFRNWINGCVAIRGINGCVATRDKWVRPF